MLDKADYISRCCAYLVAKEGLTEKQALIKSLNAWETKKKNSLCLYQGTEEIIFDLFIADLEKGKF